MKLKTFAALVAPLGLALFMTGCNDPYHGPAYASVTVATPIYGRGHHRPYYGYGPRYYNPRYARPLPPRGGCYGKGCRPMPPRHWR
ncbi:hypothetical protein [Thiofilum flexile]|uniref:hypothetical protein n=1 Tax=Thiofilum flexile TaxID=125627 RepID=UPI0003A624E3|nr:hypothetical protein [Thiofilum flexile]